MIDEMMNDDMTMMMMIIGDHTRRMMIRQADDDPADPGNRRASRLQRTKEQTQPNIEQKPQRADGHGGRELKLSPKQDAKWRFPQEMEIPKQDAEESKKQTG